MSYWMSLSRPRLTVALLVSGFALGCSSSDKQKGEPSKAPAKSGLTAKSKPASPKWAKTLARVANTPAQPWAKTDPVVIATRSGYRFNGKTSSVAPGLGAALAAWTKSTFKSPTDAHTRVLDVAVAKDVSYKEFGRLMLAIKRTSQYWQFGLLARSSTGQVVRIPYRSMLNCSSDQSLTEDSAIQPTGGPPKQLPVKTRDDPRCAVRGPSVADPVKLAVSLTKGNLSVWSLSGLEGSRSKPKLKVAAGTAGLAAVRKALAEIVRRRYPGDAKRSKKVILMIDSSQNMQAVMDLVAAVSGPAAQPLFPDVGFALSVE